MRKHHQPHCHYYERRRRLVSTTIRRRFVVVFLIVALTISSVVVVQSFHTIGNIIPAAARPRRQTIKANHDDSWWRTTSSSSSGTSLSYSSRTCPPPPPGLEEAVISQLVADTAQVEQKKKDFEKSITSLIQEVTTLQEFDNVILNDMLHGDNRLTVVRFHAPFCPACKAAEPFFHRMIYNHQKLLCTHEQQRQELGLSWSRNRRDVGPMNIHWVSVALSRENDDLRERLGLEVIPFGQIYHPSSAAAADGLILPVEGLYLGRKYIADFDKILQTYVNQKCPIPEEVEPETELEDPSVAFLNDGEW